MNSTMPLAIQQKIKKVDIILILNYKYPMKQFIFSPKYWGLWLVYLFLRLLTLLPYSFLMRLGACLGKIGYYFIGERRKIIEINISLCFPELNKKDQKALVKANIISTVKSGFETMLAYWAPDKRLNQWIEIEGIKYLEEALSQKHGVILLGAHFTTFDLAIRLLNIKLKTPASMLYRAHNNPLIETLIAKGRHRHCRTTIGKKDLSKLMKCLAENHAVLYAPDQNFSYHNEFVPFFGVKASTVTGTSRIARESQAKIVPFFYYRKPKNQGYHLQHYPALENFPSGNTYEDTARIIKLIEEAIRKHPEQYLLSHRRFKTRPPGEPLIYPKKRKKRKK